MVDGPVIRICKAVPWISELPKRVPCEGFAWSRVSGRRPQGHPANQCKFLARWHYTALTKAEAKKRGVRPFDTAIKSASLCTHHIVSHGLMATNSEIDRWEQWYETNKESLRNG